MRFLKAKPGRPPLREYKQPIAKHEASPLPGPVKSKLDKDGLRNIKIVSIYGNLNPLNVLRKKSTLPRMKDNNREYSGNSLKKLGLIPRKTQTFHIMNYPIPDPKPTSSLIEKYGLFFWNLN